MDGKKLIQEANLDLGAGIAKGGGGLIATLTAMSINDIAGLIVAILTGIYMALQIEQALIKRREAKKKKGTDEP